MQKSGCFLKIGHEKSNLRCPCSIPEDVPIDLGVIATRIETAPHCRIINAALEPLREVLEIAAFLANVLGKIFGAIVLALVALLEIFECALIPIGKIRFVCFALFLAKGGIFFDFIERAFAHAAFTIPLRREMLVILLAGCICQQVQQRAVDVLWGPQWALTECVQWGERRQWSHLRFSGAVSFLRSICRTRLEVVAATGR